MLVTFNIAFLYINILFRILKQKVVNIKNADIAGGTLEIRIQNDQIDSDINDVANSCDTSGNEKSNQIREISRPPVRFGMDNNYVSKSDIQKTNEKGEFEQNQNSSSYVENPVNTVCSSNSSQQDDYQVNASSTFNYYVTESEFETDRGIRFYPPVYIQRYNSVKDVLTCEKLTGKIKKVVEFGCAEMTFFSLFLKRIYEIEEIIEVDIDRDILNQYFHKVSPQTSDYIKMRTTPLKVQLYEGSVANTHSCLSGANAVICIELIEHLYPDDLDALPFTIFGYIRPQVAIFTTPNVDFNVLFPGLSGFRHPDHKFEWSQEQFQSWAKNLIVRYPDYQVSFEGIGNGPAGTEKYGCCSQMAVFNRNTTEAQTIPSLVDNTIQAGEYKLLREYDFPVYVDLRTEEQKICDNAVYYINRCRSMDKYELSSSSGIPLTAVLANVNCHSLAQLRDILEKNNWRICKNEYDELVIPNSSPESEEFSDSDNDYDWESRASGLQDFNSDNVSNAQADIDEDWDEQYNPFDLSGNRSTGANMEIDSTLRLDSNNGFWTTENPREYSPVNSKHVSDEKINMCIVKEGELSVPVSNNMVPELMLLNEKSETECLISNIAPTVDLCKLHTETALGEDEIYCNPELMSNHSFDKSVYKMSYKSDFFRSQNISYKSLSEEEETVCNTTLTDIEPTKDSSQEHYKESLDLHNNGKDNKICPCCNSVLQNYILPLNATEVAHKLLTAEELKKDTALSFKQNEEQIDCNDVLESNESSEILMGLQDSCSACKAVDSGYPNTSSCQDMDMDLTPEQVDEILTENESSLNGAANNDDDGGGGGSGVGHNEIESDNDCNDFDDCDDEDDRGGSGDHDINGGIHDENGGDGGIFEDILRPDSPVQFPVAPLGHNVENGDLVNNNQDNEGNNMIGQIDDEILEFEVQVNENGDLPVLAAVEGYGEDRMIDEINDVCKND